MTIAIYIFIYLGVRDAKFMQTFVDYDKNNLQLLGQHFLNIKYNVRKFFVSYASSRYVDNTQFQACIVNYVYFFAMLRIFSKQLIFRQIFNFLSPGLLGFSQHVYDIDYFKIVHQLHRYSIETKTDLSRLKNWGKWWTLWAKNWPTANWTLWFRRLTPTETGK